MAEQIPISILYPNRENITWCTVSDTTWHDLGMDAVCEKLTQKEAERTLIASVMKRMTDDPYVSEYRIGVFEDLIRFPGLRDELMKLLDKVQFLNDYGNFRREHDARRSLWELLHRFSELRDYILCVEDIQRCLNEYSVTSDGLNNLKQYVDEIYHESYFTELKKDIESLHADTSNLKSVTVGINLNQSFEVDSIGLISVNNKEFHNSGILTNLSNALSEKDGVRNGNEWNGSMKFHTVPRTSAEFENNLGAFGAFTAALYHPFMATTLVSAPDKDATRYLTRYFDKDVSQALSHLARRLEQILNRYISLSIGSIVNLIPEFLYYVRWAEYIEVLTEKGYRFSKAEILPESEKEYRMLSYGIYNLKLASVAAEDPGKIVPNDMDFTWDHTVYLLTGANRGGKTTITQAIGQLFLMAQGGIRVSAVGFKFSPADCIYTHFPADEDKTMDLGRLGEECRRFREIYVSCTGSSLLLLNETFSTTSFEEGYFIARDAVRALLLKGVRTIYNTHMHKLALEIGALNEESVRAKASSLVAQSDSGQRSFRIIAASPEGRSYAEDIAEKYGVTYEMLIKDDEVKTDEKEN